ncbi:MAG: response regulator [Leptolyngbya sp. SIO4C1]|nr:response regulator [Leptolyngbya sp. SIO4C1]
MSQDKEFEIKLQFLDEAEEYLATLETSLLDIAQRGIDIEEINSALRAAHSIKGGSGLMGYALLSDLAHRLEDSLKVLKLQRETLEIDAGLESQLLAAVDGLRQIVACDRAQSPLDPAWLETFILPIFDQLYEVLGDPTTEDASTLMASDDGQNILPMLFQTEVEGCLERLEGVIQARSETLQSEVTVMAQELGGLGEMLDLKAFSQLCYSVEAAARAATSFEQIYEVSEQALKTWRQSQALVITGNLAELPDRLSHLSFEIPEVAQPPAADSDHDAASAPAQADSTFDIFAQTNAEAAAGTLSETPADSEADFDPAQAQPAALSGTQIRFSNGQTAATKEAGQDTTVRVSARKLNELNDFFGELTIERNRLGSEIKRLRQLAELLAQRLRALDDFSLQLRDVYDNTTRQSHQVPLLLPGTAENGQLALSTANAALLPNGFDALEMDSYDAHHLPVREQIETVVQLQEVADDIELGIDTAEQSMRNLQRTARSLQRNLNQLRMRPLSDVTNRFPRALRELCVEYGKQVDLQIEGDHTLIDRNILEALNDPLLHILRNAFDHGIETPDRRRQQGKPEKGTISIQAAHHSNRTQIVIGDDGSGIPIDKIRQRAKAMGLDETLLATASEADLLSLIFEPGFSTADNVTTLSGRGVGMDIVRNNLKQIRGDISVSTQPGQGTAFTISVPYTLSVTRVLLSESNRMPIAFPTDSVQEITMVAPEDCYERNGQLLFDWNGQAIRLIKLAKWLAFNCPRQIDSLDNTPNVAVPSVLVVRYNQQYCGLQIDRSWGEQEVAVRQVEGLIALPAGFSSCTILGDGKVVPLVNVSELLRWITNCEGSNIQSAQVLYANPLLSGALSSLSIQPSGQNRLMPTVLIVDDSVNVRRLLALTLEKQGYKVAQAKDGLDALEKLEAGLEVQAIICDIEMPRLDGYGFLSRLRGKPAFARMPVTMLTSRSGDKHRQLAMNLGATAYFSKPYREQALLKTLEDAIRSPVMT